MIPCLYKVDWVYRVEAMGQYFLKCALQTSSVSIPIPGNVLVIQVTRCHPRGGALHSVSCSLKFEKLVLGAWLVIEFGLIGDEVSN